MKFQHRKSLCSLWVMGCLLFPILFYTSCSLPSPQTIRLLWIYGENGRILSSSSYGGFLKEVALLQEIRSTENIQAILQGGNFLPSDLVMAKQSAEIFRQGFDLAGVDVCTLGPAEIQTSASILKYLSEGNCRALGTYIESPPLTRFFQKEIQKGLTLGVASAIPKSLPSIGDVVLNTRQINETLNTLRSQANLLILLTHESRLQDALNWLNQYPEIDLILGRIVDMPEKDTPVLTTSYGKSFILSWNMRSMGAVELEMDIRRGTITRLKTQWKPVEATQKEAESLRPLQEEYLKQREVLGLSGKRATLVDYSGALSCNRCHEKLFEAWRASKHAYPFNTLIRTRDEYNPQCLPCHVTGFGKPGGFLNPRDTLSLANVQCEACHSPALQHTLNPSTKVSVPRRTQCLQCHTPQWSPAFHQVIQSVDAHSLQKGK